MKKKVKKIIPYYLILIMLVGLFGPAEKVNAQAANGSGTCYTYHDITKLLPYTEGPCRATSNIWVKAGDPPPQPGTMGPGGVRIPAATPAGETDFQRIIREKSCGLGWATGGGSLPGCGVQISYLIFYTIPAYLLWAAAQFFNVLIAITLGSKLLADSDFISKGWTVARDLSNLFFILILLYIGIKIILGLGGTEVKKMIAQVVIMALLINFSMFMTKVVIDTSNILALIFYNRLAVNKVDSSGKTVPIQYTPVLAKTLGVEKDVAGALTAAFDPTSLLTEDFFKKAGEQCSGIPGRPCVPGEPSVSILIGITIIAGMLMFFAAYTFFVAGISFVGRLIELWVLIIFSPFAFMSSTVPLLARTEYIGWDSWLKRLFKVSFMAPIFMFFLYFIFLLLQQGNPFGNVIEKNGGAINTILLVVIPAVIILILLLKATEFAKKGGGKLGEFASTTGKIIGGLTVGAVTGGAAWAARGAIGGGLGGLANKVGAKRVGSYLQSKSFDVRAVPGTGKLLGVAGLAAGAGAIKTKEGGWTQMRKEQVEKRQKRADELVSRKTAGKKKNMEEAEAKLDEATLPVKVKLDNANKEIEKFRNELNDAQKGGDVAMIATAKGNLAAAKRNKSNIRTTAGLDILETQLHNAQRELDTEIGKVASAEANRVKSKWSKTWGLISNFGAYSVAGADEASRNIRRRAKLETKT